MLLTDARAMPPAPPLVLDRFDLIAELKLRSPAMGGLAEHDFDREAQLRAYAAGGAAAVSVLTEPDEFKGSLDHLREAAEILRPLGIPVMRKDFLIDPYQLIEARANGAGGALLIMAMLDDRLLDDMLVCAAELELFILLEAFDERDLERIALRADLASKQPTLLAGLNCRNLRSLAVDFNRFAALAGQLPANLPTVAESGVTQREDIVAVAGLGYRLALVGSALMQSGDTAATVADFVAAGRSH
jgi:indole-3-glycerol phosphate synthase